MQQAGPAIFAIGGKLIGSYLGGPIGGMIGGLAGGLIGSMIFNRGQKPLIPDIPVMSSAYGNPIPIIWGTVRLPGTVIWMSPVTTHGHGAGKGVGGLGGGTSAYSYWQDVMVGFCSAPARLIKIFLDGKLFLDNTTQNGELTKYRFAIREYDGDEDQLPDVKYTTWVDLQVGLAGMAPAYRGLTYLYFDKIDLAHFGNRFPQVTAVWSSDVTDTTIFRRLNRQVPDISSGLFAPLLETQVASTGIGTGTAVDWGRNRAYQLTASGNVLVYDLQTQQCIVGKTIQQLSVGYSNMAAMIGQLQPFQGLCCGFGTKLYLWAHGPLFSTIEYVWTLDPDTLTVIKETDFHDASNADTIFQMICFTLSSAEGNFEMLAGNTIFATPDIGCTFVLEPIFGAIGHLHATFEGAFSSHQTVVGNQDPVTGATDLWLISGGEFDTTGSIYIQKAVVTGSDPSDIAATAVLVATLGPADFGITDPTPLWTGGIGRPVYNPSDDSLIFTNVEYGTHSGPSGNFSFKWSQSSGVMWVNRNWVGPQWPMTNTILDRGMIAGDIAWLGGHISVVDTATGAISQSPIAAADFPRSPTAVTGNIRYDSYSNSLVYTDEDGYLYVAYLQRTFGNEVSVAAIIQDICGRVGLQTSDVDVSQVTNTVFGYALTEQKSAGAALADLCHCFQLDMVESDYTLRFVPRGQPTAATITQSDLGSVDANDPGKFWIAHDTQELEMPLLLSVKYQDPDLDYNPGSEYARRTALPVPTVITKRRRSLDLPIIATAIEARQIAEKWLYTMWAERETYDTVLSMKYLWLDPGDSITVNLDDGSTYGTRIETHEVGADLSMKLTVTSEDATVYAGSSSRGALVGTVPQTIVQTPFGNILLFNIPLLQDSDDTGGTSSRTYFAAGVSGSWGGGGMYNSLDGASWTLLTTLPLAVDWGYAVNALGNTPAAFATDYANTLRVTFSSGSTIPSSCSYTDLMNGVNAAVLGSEIIQFQTVTDNGDGTFTLSVLARGRRGTEWATGTHHAGENLVMLETGKLGTYRMPVAQIGQLESWRLVPLGRFLDQVPASSFAYLGYDLKPYAPINFSRTPSGSDLVLAWVRRTRLGGLLVDGTDTAPLGEASEAYEVYLLASAAALPNFDPTVPATYVRAFTGLTAPTVTYAAAQMTADGFTPGTGTLYMVAYQISAVIGRGFQGYQALPPS